MGFLPINNECNKWPKHQIQQLYQLTYNDSWDFINKFLQIKPSKYREKLQQNMNQNINRNLSQSQQRTLSFLSLKYGEMTLPGSGTNFLMARYKTNRKI